MFRFGPFDIRKVWYFGVDTTSILRAPTPRWRLPARLRQSFCIARYGIAIDTFSLRPVFWKKCFSQIWHSCDDPVRPDPVWKLSSHRLVTYTCIPPAVRQSYQSEDCNSPPSRASLVHSLPQQIKSQYHMAVCRNWKTF